MASGSMLCLKVFSFILVAGLCLSANGNRPKLSAKESKYIPREFRIQDTSATKTIHGERNSYDVHKQRHLSKNHCPCNQTKRSSGEIDRMTSQDGSTSSTTMKKNLVVWMTSLSYGVPGLTVYDSDKVIYRIDNHDNKQHTKDVLLKTYGGELVFTIHRKSHWLGSSFVGHRGSGNSASSSKQSSFRVQTVPCDCLHPREHSWEVVYDDEEYTLSNILEKSVNANMEFKLTNAEGKTIVELRQKPFYSWKVPVGQESFILKVAPEADVSFAVALVAVFGMINDKI